MFKLTYTEKITFKYLVNYIHLKETPKWDLIHEARNFHILLLYSGHKDA